MSQIWRIRVDGEVREPKTWADPDKRKAAVVFRKPWKRVREDPEYERSKTLHQEQARRNQA